MDERFERFSYAIFEISKCWHKLANEEMEPFGLKGPHSTYLTIMLNHKEGITAPKICELSGRDKADVSRAISILTEKGLVKKEGANGNLYRGTLTLTKQGVVAATQISKRVAMAVNSAGEGLSDEDRKIFYKCLEIITTNLQGLCKDGIPYEWSSVWELK